MNTKEKNEEHFHNAWAASADIEKIDVMETFESCTSPENQFILKELGDLKGKIILDLGTGLGEAAIFFALKGATVFALDISGDMLRTTRKLASRYRVSVDAVKSPSSPIPLGSESIDIVYCANLLHHVDIETTLQEANRVLKPGGMFVSYDPIKYNPIINIYRRIANKVRTVDEKPLGRRELNLVRNYFPKTRYTTFWFATLLIFIKFFLFDRVDPNKERYWKKIVTDHQQLRNLYLPLKKTDDILLAIFPFLKWYCWNLVIAAEK
ncbi:MAG: class I SAM-dependent methyltransferase [Pseudomonadota bacterium]